MIIGAGLAGLIAAHVFPREVVCEVSDEPQQMHRALLRFRSDAISRLTGIPFKKVRVRKGIFFNDNFHEPNIALANMHSQNCLGSILGDRSIWNIDAADRFIAPETLYEQLIDAVGNRIMWGSEVDFKLAKGCASPFINTAPLPVVLASLGIDPPVELRRAPITVQRYRVEYCDAYQTIYFPDMNHSLYRASITGDLLICEFQGDPLGDWEAELNLAFALLGNYEPIGTYKQAFGKIADIAPGIRKALIHKLTVDHNIFSLGRFATWRNVLLDDVLDDAAVVKRLATAGEYDRKLASL
jgi:hypothetical protein